VERLSALDVGVFATYMLLLVGVGVYFTRQQKGLKSYLLADQNIHWIIVAVSVLAALFSGITYLGAPGETYKNDLTYLWVIASFFIATPITTLLFLPFFRNLNLYTAYEYLHRRFDRRVHWTVSLLYILRICGHLGLAVYAPALAIMAVTGWPLWLSVTCTGLAATLYTALGGMKAVIWTDTLQFLVLCGGSVLVLASAIAGIPGGFPAAWQTASAAGKTHFLPLEFDLSRMTVWNAVLGGASINLIQMVTDQISVQRYLTAPSLRDSQRALWLKLWVTLPLLLVFSLTGTVLFAYYRIFSNRGPLPERTDQILPFFVVHELPSPFAGLLIAAIFGATMAVASAGINALATTVLVDFGGAARTAGQGPGGGVLRARLLTVFFGILITVLGLGLGQTDATLVQSIFLIQGIFGGPSLGIFFLGVLSRRANGPGVLAGATAGGCAGALIAFSGKLFSYPISPLWIAFSSAIVTFLAGLLASLLFPAPRPDQLALVYRSGYKGPDQQAVRGGSRSTPEGITTRSDDVQTHP
jgi:sodium-coupled monocarboxylate transporter 8/12